VIVDPTTPIVTPTDPGTPKSNATLYIIIGGVVLLLIILVVVLLSRKKKNPYMERTYS
jgi:LPXTG-motif cell wall-anchored protein